MTKQVSQSRTSTSRFPVLRTVAGVLAAAAIAWVIVDRYDTPSVQPAVSESASADSKTRRSYDKPLWDDLSSTQQVALAPLEPEWNQMEGPRKRRWIEMSARFASMGPTEQQRVHERMRQWMKLTPAQRELARENYSRANRLAQGDKAADWENYKQLSDAQKRSLARSRPETVHKSLPVALPETPMLVVPTPCPPNTSRRGAECIVAGAPDVPAAVAPAPSAIAATPAPNTPAPAPAPAVPAAPGNAASVPTPQAAAADNTAQGSSAPASQASNAGN